MLPAVGVADVSWFASFVVNGQGGEELVQIAAERGHLRTVKLLVKKGARPDVRHVLDGPVAEQHCACVKWLHSHCRSAWFHMYNGKPLPSSFDLATLRAEVHPRTLVLALEAAQRHEERGQGLATLAYLLTTLDPLERVGHARALLLQRFCGGLQTRASTQVPQVELLLLRAVELDFMQGVVHLLQQQNASVNNGQGQQAQGKRCSV